MRGRHSNPRNRRSIARFITTTIPAIAVSLAMFAGALPAASALETAVPETAVDNVDNSVSAQTQTPPPR